MIMALAGPMLGRSNALLLANEDMFFNLDSRIDRLNAEHYEDRRPAGRTIM